MRGKDDRSAAQIIDKLTDTISTCIAAVRDERNPEPKLPETAIAVLTEVLQLTTVYFHCVYRVPEDCIPENVDDLDEFDEYLETAEYEPRNKLVMLLMTLQVVGAQKAKALGNPYPTSFITAIKTLRQTCHERTGQGLERNDAATIINNPQAEISELAILSRPNQPFKDDSTAIDVLKDFFTPEDDHYGVSEIWYSEEISESLSNVTISDEEWAIEHSGATVGLFLIPYENGFLSLRDVNRWNPRGEAKTRFDYPNIAQPNRIRFTALISLLRQLERDGGNEKALITPPDNQNWRGQFQPKDVVAHRFNQDQILPRIKKNRQPTKEWRLKNNREIKPSPAP